MALDCSDIQTLTDTFERYGIWQGVLQDFCKQAVPYGDYHLVGDVRVDGATVHFKTGWSGPYNSRDTSHWEFPTAMLLDGPAEVKKYLRQKHEADIEAIREKNRADQERLDRMTYESLHKRFGGETK